MAAVGTTRLSAVAPLQAKGSATQEAPEDTDVGLLSSDEGGSTEEGEEGREGGREGGEGKVLRRKSRKTLTLVSFPRREAARRKVRKGGREGRKETY